MNRAISVVLADDDARYLDALRELVEQQPQLSVVAVARDGVEAIERVDELDPDAVVIDLHMPRLDGVSAIARMRRDHANLCLIALTGDPEPTLHRAVEAAGADTVMLKGQLLDGLTERITQVRRERDALASAG
ncbi:MAG: response regulator transcription factor [Actinomycetota bacterium]|nr:response regulator transcription factor [Actinomycetota bacterium]